MIVTRAHYKAISGTQASELAPRAATWRRRGGFGAISGTQASSHLERPRGGEEEGLAVGRDDAHDGVHVLLKPHIEHPISFVKDCVAHLMREVIRMQSASSRTA